MIIQFIILLHICFAAGNNGIISSTYRLPCGTRCKWFDGYFSYLSFYYCYTERGWDFCSPYPELDFVGETCLTVCMLIDNAYQCGVGNQKRYCSISTSKPIQLDSAGNICTSACEKKTIPTYYTCNSMKPNGVKYLGYCSPSKNVDCRNIPCQSYETRNGYLYCYPGSGNYMYSAGLIEDSGCSSREINPANTCPRTFTGPGNRIFTVQPLVGHGNINGPTNKRLFDEAKVLVEAWRKKDEDLQFDDVRTNIPLIKQGQVKGAPNLRLDLQKKVGPDDFSNLGYANIAIQKEDTMNSQILMPLGIKVPLAALRFALLESWRTRLPCKIIEGKLPKLKKN